MSWSERSRPDFFFGSGPPHQVYGQTYLIFQTRPNDRVGLVGLLLTTPSKLPLTNEKRSFMRVILLDALLAMYSSPGKCDRIADVWCWNYKGYWLHTLKLWTIEKRSQMRRRLNDRMDNYFTEYYKPLMPRVNKLRQVVIFPKGRQTMGKRR